MAKSRQSVSPPSDRTSANEPDDLARELAELRDAIDDVDRQILASLNERAGLVKRVGEAKRTTRSPVYVAGRERDLVASLAESNPGPFPSEAISHVFREIVSATRSLEEKVSVAFLGPEGTFCHQAAMRQFGAQVSFIPAASLSEVFAFTEKGKSHFGIVPIENTTEGAVTETFDALVESELTICGELLLMVSQTLLNQSGRLEDIRKVASHPQGLAQCRHWLQASLPHADWVESSSTAAAAQHAAADTEVAAIGSEVAAEAYGLRIVEHGIEDRRGNSTRFLVIGRDAPAPSGDDHTSAVFTVRKDQSGALHSLLEPFAGRGVNLSSIQSRPMKGKPWEYLFFVDMEGHAGQPAVAKALEEASAVAYSYKLLGSYPRARKPQARLRSPGAR